MDHTERNQMSGFAKPSNAYASRVEDEHAADRATMCKAHECPNRWSVSTSMLCGPHAWAPSHQWPAITDEQYRLLAKRQDGAPRYREVKPMTEAEKRAAIEKLKLLARTPDDPKKWARRLKEREQSGERLSMVQQQMWREVLREHS
jgi:hypothetical protein